MAHHHGMQTMGYRTTFAFDGGTMRRLKNQAARWQVSQAEVVRRALSLAEKYLCEVREDRERWRL